DEHQEILKPIAALLGSAVEHWRIWDGERRRAERLQRTEALFATLAESLDVREVFPRLSQGMQPILPHGFMVLTRLDVRARTIQVTAYAGDLEGPVPMQAVTLTEQEMEQRPDFEIIDDVQTAFAPETEREKLVVSSGMRSWLRVPVVILGEQKGSL